MQLKEFYLGKENVMIDGCLKVGVNVWYCTTVAITTNVLVLLIWFIVDDLTMVAKRITLN